MRSAPRGGPILHLFLAAENVAHRAAGQHRAEDGQRLGQGIDLAAEAAADGSSDEMKGVRGHVRILAQVSSEKNSACVEV